MKSEDLIGRPVMVHPYLHDDPAMRMGEIATIIEADLVRDLVQVRFDDDEDAFYTADALLVPKEPEKIYHYLENSWSKIHPQDYNDLYSIALLIEYGTPKHLRTAIEIAQANEDIQFNGLHSLETAASPGYQNGYDR